MGQVVGREDSEEEDGEGEDGEEEVVEEEEERAKTDFYTKWHVYADYHTRIYIENNPLLQKSAYSCTGLRHSCVSHACNERCSSTP